MKKLIHKVENTQDDILFPDTFKSYFAGIFSYGGRENRRAFIYHLITYFITSIVTGFALGIVLFALHLSDLPKADIHELATIIIIPAIICLWACFFRRLRDAGLTTLGIFVTLFIYICLIVICPEQLIVYLFVLLMIIAACFKTDLFLVNPKSFWTCLFRSKKLKPQPENIIDHQFISDDDNNNETL